LHQSGNKKILISPLNWGLGHATRCIPVINALLEENFEPILAGDGDSLKLLQKEFPELKFYELPSYNIRYTKKGSHLKFKLMFEMPKILKTIDKEKQAVQEIIEKEKISGIISDNRFGVRSKKVPSVYITHQINVLSGNTTFFTSKIHHKIIAEFDECWIPDHENEPNLAGKLSHIRNAKLNLKYIGPLSRFTYNESVKKYDLLVLLSGPEPQRSLYENIVLDELKSYTKKVMFVRGIISEKQEIQKDKNITMVNFMLQNELQTALSESDLIIARSGYSTIMDLEKLRAKAFFIPTPGQYEQEYLANYLEQQKIAPYAKQDDFKIKMLDEIKKYNGFNKVIKRDKNRFSFEDLF
jgi:uncharacterized protein (TIGR00661 family)